MIIKIVQKETNNMSNQKVVISNNDDLSYGEIIGLSIMSCLMMVALIFFISKLVINFLIIAFGYNNFDSFNMNNNEMTLWISGISIFILFLIGFMAKNYKKFGIYLILISIILAGVTSVIFYQSSGLTFEQYTYRESLSKFESIFLKNEKNSLNKTHPDLITFYHYKNNPTLDKSDRQSYFNSLKKDDITLKSLSKFTTVYNMGSFATYFVNSTKMEKFFMTYSDVTDPHLKSLMENMLKSPLVKTTDYIAFHTLYRQQFIAKNATMLKNNAILIDTQNRRMTDVNEVSNIIHFFEKTNAPELNGMKGLFVSMLTQPTVTELEINQFRTQLTQTLKSNPQLYTLMSQL